MILEAPVTHSSPESLLYESVAEQIAQLIDLGTLRPGERIPSVRKLSRQRRVSISTILQAYRVLENRGLIEARPQSGYFVRVKPWTPPAEPEISRPAKRATQVNVSELAVRVMKATRDPALVRLGAALPSPELLPTVQLNRCLAAVSRRNRTLGSNYSIPPGNSALRIQIARRALDTGCTLAPDDIVTTVGGMEALNICLRAVTKPGDTIAIESPTYFGILQCIESLGLKALEIPTHPRDGVSLDALAYALETQPIAACLFVLNFNNPLGSCMPDAHKEQLVAMLAEREIPLIEDDLYGDLPFNGIRPRTAKSFDRKGLVLLCDSFSKTLAPGYRVGWCAPGQWQERVELLKMVTTVATPTLPQMAVADFLANGGYEHHLRRIRKLYAEKVQLVSQAVGEFFPEGTRVTRPTGGYVLWVELPTQVNSLELFDRALAAGISIAPGPLFSAKGKFTNFIRLNCGNPWTPQIESALRTLGQMAAEVGG
ncbi:aminotransferase-like domain-containing protein [Verrucomicrobiota bacterium sgz303538]